MQEPEKNVKPGSRNPSLACVGCCFLLFSFSVFPLSPNTASLTHHDGTGGFWVLPIAVQNTNAPTLTIAPAGPGQATVAWTPATPGYVLQENLNLATTSWVSSPSGATNPIVVPATLPAKFYRLFKL